MPDRSTSEQAQLDPFEERAEPPGGKRKKRNLKLVESFQVVVTCIDESQQRELYERLSDQGFICRLLML